MGEEGRYQVGVEIKIQDETGLAGRAEMDASDKMLFRTDAANAGPGGYYTVQGDLNGAIAQGRGAGKKSSERGICKG